MYLPPGVTLLSSQSSPYLTAANQSGTQTVYRYTVGEHGPFQVALRGADDTPANVIADMQKRVDALAQLGYRAKA